MKLTNLKQFLGLHRSLRRVGTHSSAACRAAILLLALLFIVQVPAADNPASATAVKPTAQGTNALALELNESRRSEREGLVLKSLESAERALKICSSLPGEPGVGTAEALLQMVKAQVVMGDYEKAGLGVVRAVELFKQAGKTSDARYAKCLRALGVIELNRTNLTAALDAATGAFELQTKLLDPVDPELSSGLTLLARIKKLQGDEKQASQLIRRARANLDQAIKLKPTTVEYALAIGEVGDYLGQKLRDEAGFKMVAETEGILTQIAPAHWARGRFMVISAANKFFAAFPQSLKNPETARTNLSPQVAVLETGLSIVNAAMGTNAPVGLRLSGVLAMSHATVGMMLSQQEDATRQAIRHLERARELFKISKTEDSAAHLRTLTNLADSLGAVNEDSRQIEVLREALPLLKLAKGPADATYRREVLSLAIALHRVDQKAEAAKQFGYFLTLQELAGLGDSDETRMAKVMLGVIASLEGNFAKALSFKLEELTQLRAVGETDRRYVHELCSSATLASLAREPEKIEPLLRSAIAAHRAASQSGTTLEQSAMLLVAEGQLDEFLRLDSELAGRHYGEARDLFIRSSSTNLSFQVKLARALGRVSWELDDHASVLSYAKEELELAAKLPETERDLALIQAHHSFGRHYAAVRDYTNSVLSLEAAIHLSTNSVIELPFASKMRYLNTGLATELAFSRVMTGNFAAANKAIAQARAVVAAVGTNWPTSAAGIWIEQTEAFVYSMQGRYSEAYDLARSSGIHLGNGIATRMDDASERQQLAMAELGNPTFIILSLGRRAGVPATELLSDILRSSGSAFSRQAAIRELRRMPEFGPILSRLERLKTEASAARSVASFGSLPMPGAERSAEKLNAEAELLERDLAKKSATYSRAKASAQLGVPGIQGLLPQDAALVYFVEFARLSRTGTNFVPMSPNIPPKSDSAYGAFVVRNGREVEFRDLGMKPDITNAITQWHTVISTNRHVWNKEMTTGSKVRELVWDPIAKDLAGAKIVFVTGDGEIARLPFGALPMGPSGHYLLEEVGFVTLPVIQQLAMVLRDERPLNEERLLLVGDVDYGPMTVPENNNRLASAKVPAPSAGKRPGLEVGVGTVPLVGMAASRLELGPTRYSGPGNFRPLDHTGGEIEAIKGPYSTRRGVIVEFKSTEASEAKVRTAIKGSRWVHLATHGFYATERLPGALGERGGLELGGLYQRPRTTWELSGVALAGANRRGGNLEDDGIWTAAEAGYSDLSGTEMVVLSACESAVGKATSSEGLLGLQRGFLLGGARTVVGTLWEVPDLETKKLMVHFYRNLWEHKMGKLGALRQAQLRMMKEAWLTRERGESGERISRGSPYYWAAFVLSGDWR